MTTFHLAGGCFWCLDAVYRSLRGVDDVVSGYAGGTVADPDYETVCSGTTGHAETAQIVFDETRIPAETILDVFFTMHDPTQVNRQGGDIGTQYRSAMFYTDEAQREQFTQARDRAAEWWGGAVTQIEPLQAFYRAEGYHQDFYAKNPRQGYCMVVTRPKVLKIRKKFAEYAR